MSDRGVIFLISVAVILVSLACSGWLIATTQALSVDGLFLLLTCLLIALCFALYCIFLIRKAKEEAQPAPAKKSATRAED